MDLMHLHILQAVLKGAVGLLALPNFDQVSADRQARRVEYMQEAAVLSLHAESLKPVAAHRLQHTQERSAQSPTRTSLEADVVSAEKPQPSPIMQEPSSQ